MPRLNRTLGIVILLCMVLGIWCFQGCGGGNGNDPVGPMVTGSISGTVNASGTLASLQGTEASLLAAVSVASVSVYIEDYPQYAARTDGTGKFIISPVPFATHRVISVIQTSSNHMYKQRSGPISVRENAPAADAGSLSLLPATLYARIKLQDSTGQPVTGATVRVWGQLFVSTTTPGEYISPAMPDVPVDPLTVTAANFQTTTIAPVFTPESTPAVMTVTLPKTTETNRAPLVSLKASSYSVSGVTQVTLTASATDLDGDALDYSWVAATGSIASGSSSMLGIWTPPSGSGVATVTFIATEKSPKTASGKATVNITYSTGGGGNNPPTADLIATVSNSVQINSTISLSAANVNDPDGDAVTLGWSATGGTLGGTSGTPVSWTAPATTGQVTVTLTVSDGKGGTNSYSLVLNVTNSAPTPTGLTVKISSPLPNQLLQKGTVLFSGQATNNTGVLNPRDNYRWYVNGPGYAGLVAQDVKTFNLNLQTAATYTVWLQATDSSSIATDTVSFRINSPPVAHLLQPANNSLSLLGAPVTFVGSGSDTEDISIPSASITWWLNGTQVAAGSSTTQTALPAGSSTMMVRVADRLGTYATATVIVGVNVPPVVTVVSPAPNTVFSAGSNVTLTGLASDPDTLTTLSGNNVGWYRGTTFLGSGTSWDATAQLTPGSSYTITLWAFDNTPGAARGYASASFDIRINPNATPTCTISSPTSSIMALQGSDMTFVGLASDPEDGLFSNLTNPGSMTWRLASGTTLPPVLPTIPLGTGETFATTSFPVGTSTIIFNATDRWGAKATATVVVVGNMPPTLTISAPASSVFNVGDRATFTGAGTTALGKTIPSSALSWVISPDIAGFSRNATSTFAFSLSGAPGTYTVTLTGSDTYGVVGSVDKLFYLNGSPTASITLPLNGARFDTDGPFTLKAEFGDQDPTEPLTFQWYAWYQPTNATSSMGLGVVSGNGSTLLSTLSTTTTTLASGPYQFSFAVKDSQGMVSTSSVMVLIDREPHISAIYTSYTQYATAPGNVPVYLASANIPLYFYGTTSDYEAAGGALPNASLSWTMVTKGGGSTLVSTSTAPAAAYQLVQTFSPGAATLTLRAVDSWGVASAATFTFRIWDAYTYSTGGAPKGIDFLRAAKQFLVTVGGTAVQYWNRSDVPTDYGRLVQFDVFGPGSTNLQMVRGIGGGLASDSIASLYFLRDVGPNQLVLAESPTRSTSRASDAVDISYGINGAGANAAEFQSPVGMDIVPPGTSITGPSSYYMYIADTANHRVRRIYNSPPPIWAQGGGLTLCWPIDDPAAGAGSGNLGLNTPKGLKVDIGVDNNFYVFVADSGNNRVVRLDKDLIIKASYSGAANATELAFCDGAGSDIGGGINKRWMFVSNPTTNLIMVYDKENPSAGQIMSFGGNGTSFGRFQTPNGIYVIGDYLYVCETGGNRIHKIYTGGW